MPKFIAIIEHLDLPEGYFIRDLQAQTLKQAREEFEKLMPNYYDNYGDLTECDFGEFPISSVQILEVSFKHDLDLEKWFYETKKKNLERKTKTRKGSRKTTHTRPKRFRRIRTTKKEI